MDARTDIVLAAGARTPIGRLAIGRDRVATRRLQAAANLTVFTQTPGTLDIEIVRTVVAGHTVYAADPA